MKCTDLCNCKSCSNVYTDEDVETTEGYDDYENFEDDDWRNFDDVVILCSLEFKLNFGF